MSEVISPIHFVGTDKWKLSRFWRITKASRTFCYNPTTGMEIGFFIKEHDLVEMIPDRTNIDSIVYLTVDENGQINPIEKETNT